MTVRDEIRSASDDYLAREREPWRVLRFAKNSAGPSEAPLEIGDSPELTLALLRSVRGVRTTGSLQRRAVSRSPILNWDLLVYLYGSEDLLKTRLENLKARFTHMIESQEIQLDDAEGLLEQAGEYLSGQRTETD